MARGRRRRGSIFSPADYIRWSSIKGLFSNDRFWGTVFILMTGRKVLGRVLGSGPEVVAVEKLKPGQFIQIEAIDPATLEPTKRRRRK